MDIVEEAGASAFPSVPDPETKSLRSIVDSLGEALQDVDWENPGPPSSPTLSCVTDETWLDADLAGCAHDTT